MKVVFSFCLALLAYEAFTCNVAATIPSININMSTDNHKKRREKNKFEGKSHSSAAQEVAYEHGYARRSDGSRRTFAHRKSAYSGKYSIVGSDQGDIVIKYFTKGTEEKNKEAFLREKGSFTSDKRSIKDYEKRVYSESKKCSLIIQILGYSSWYSKNSNGCVEKHFAAFLQRAHGQTLDELLEDNSPDLDLERIFFKIGKQLGNTFRLYYGDDLYIRHPDPHMINFMYDRVNNQLAWIDITGIKTEPRGQRHELNIALFTRDMPKLALDFAQGEVLDGHGNKRPASLTQALKIITAHQSLLRGYKSAVKDYREAMVSLEAIFRANREDSSRLAYLSYDDFIAILQAIQNIYENTYAKKIDLLSSY